MLQHEASKAPKSLKTDVAIQFDEKDHVKFLIKHTK